MRNAVLTFIVVAAAFCGAEEPRVHTAPQIPPDQKKLAEQFIKSLASDDYAERARAREGLMGLRRAAIEPLESAAQSIDAEVRSRAIEILIALRGRGFLGVMLAEDPGDTGETASEDEDAVVRVKASQLAPNANPNAPPYPAEAAGVQAGDTLEAVNDKPVRGTKDFMREIIKVGPGRVAMVTVERAGKTLRLPIQLTLNRILPGTIGGVYTGQPEAPRPLVDLENDGAPPPQVQRPIQVPNILERPAQPAPRQQKLEIRVGPAVPPQPQQQPNK